MTELDIVEKSNKIRIQLNPRTGRYRILSKLGTFKQSSFSKKQIFVPRFSTRWDGSLISEKKQCKTCSYLQEAEVIPYPAQTDLMTGLPEIMSMHGPIIGICRFGVALKVVVKENDKKPMKCSKVD